MSSEYGIYLYGSSARGDAVEQSDVDILVLFEKRVPIDKDEIELPRNLGASVGCDDISYYSLSRVTEMFESGHLFAWHLHNEAIHIGDGPDRLKMLGQPHAYNSFSEDTEALIGLLKSIPESVKKAPRNAAYEAGLAYVCARNIAMSASYYSPNGLTFSAYAPFRLGYDDNEFPLSLEQYDLLRRARLSGSRGVDAPDIGVESLLRLVEKLMAWCTAEIGRIERKSR